MKMSSALEAVRALLQPPEHAANCNLWGGSSFRLWADPCDGNYDDV